MPKPPAPTVYIVDLVVPGIICPVCGDTRILRSTEEKRITCNVCRKSFHIKNKAAK